MRNLILLICWSPSCICASSSCVARPWSSLLVLLCSYDYIQRRSQAELLNGVPPHAAASLSWILTSSVEGQVRLSDLVQFEQAHFESLQPKGPKWTSSGPKHDPTASSSENACL